MNVYKIAQTVNNDYDTYSDAVVVATDEEQARKTSPSGYYEWSDEHGSWMFKYSDGTKRPEGDYDSWAHPKDVTVELVGVADAKYTEPTVICASFHAG